MDCTVCSCIADAVYETVNGGGERGIHIHLTPVGRSQSEETHKQNKAEAEQIVTFIKFRAMQQHPRHHHDHRRILIYEQDQGERRTKTKMLLCSCPAPCVDTRVGCSLFFPLVRSSLVSCFSVASEGESFTTTSLLDGPLFLNMKRSSELTRKGRERGTIF